MESYTLPSDAFPSELQEITLALWTGLTDAAGLRQRLIAASTMQGDQGEAERKRLDYAFLDSKMIASRQHILTAAQQAILSASQGQLRTQTIHSEVIDHLNPTSNIGEGLRRFGISAGSTSVLLVKIDKLRNADEKTTLQREMAELLPGATLASLDSLENGVDLPALKKVYKMAKSEDLTPELLVTYTAMNKTVGVL